MKKAKKNKIVEFKKKIFPIKRWEQDQICAALHGRLCNLVASLVMMLCTSRRKQIYPVKN